MPRFSHILVVSAGQDEPAKIRVLRIVWKVDGGGRRGGSAADFKVSKFWVELER